jgi:hypothetical protein
MPKLQKSISQTNLIPQPSQWFIAFFGLFVLTIIAGYSPVTSLMFALYSFATSIAGQFIFLGFAKRRDFNFLELLGSGIVIGTILPGIFNFIIQTYSGLHQSSALIAFFSISIYARRKNQAFGSTESPDNDKRLVFFTIASAAFAFAQFSHIYYIFGLIVLLLIYITNQGKICDKFDSKFANWRYLVGILGFIPLVIWLVKKIADSPPIWRQLTYIDQLFDESQSWSLARNGFNENPFIAGSSLPGHTLTHSWAGLAQYILEAPPFVTSGSAGILLALLGTGALLGGFAYRSRKKISSIIGVFFIWVFQMSVTDQFGVAPNPRIANSLSLLWFLFTVLLLLEATNKNLRFPYLLIPLFIGLTGFAKIHWAFFLLVCYGIVAFYEFAVLRFRRNFIISIVSLLAVLLVYLLYIRGLNAYATFAIHFSISNFLIYSAVLFNRSLGIYSASKSAEHSYLQKLFLVAFLFFPAFIAVTGTTNQQTYFITCSLIIISLMQGPSLFEKLGLVWRANWKLKLILTLFGLSTLVISIAATGFYWKVFENSTKSDFNKQLFSFVSNQETYLAAFSLIFSGLVFPLFAYREKQKRNLYFLSAVLASLLFVANTSAFFAQSTRTLITDRLYGRQLSELSLSDDQITVGEWIRSNSTNDSIIATNHYCQILVEENQRVPITPEDCRQKNMNSWLSAISQRKSFFEAPVVSVFGPGKALSTNEASVYNLSLRVGQNPTNVDLEILENSGVTYFVAENQVSEISKFSNLRSIVYSNSTYTVFRLNPSN